MCQALRPCVECMAFEEESDSNCTTICPYNYYEAPTDSVPNTWNNCTFFLDDCKYTFSYSYYANTQDVHSLILHLWNGDARDTVSYTHLTLPTIYSV